MGRIKTKLIKRISLKIHSQHSDEFKTDFEENKKIVEKFADIPSKTVGRTVSYLMKPFWMVANMMQEGIDEARETDPKVLSEMKKKQDEKEEEFKKINSGYVDQYKGLNLLGFLRKTTGVMGIYIWEHAAVGALGQDGWLTGEQALNCYQLLNCYRKKKKIE